MLGLLLPVTDIVAQHLGLRVQVVDSRRSTWETAPGRKRLHNPGDKLLTLVASAYAGWAGDFI